MGKPPFNDKRVRWAMNYAIDREAICKSIFGGTAIPSLSTGAPSVFGYHKIEKPYHQYDPEKARELLAEAGYPNGFEVNCWMATGRFQMDRVEAESLVAYWADIGVKVNLEIMEYATLDAKQREQMNLYWKKGVVPDWDMSFWSWGDGTMDPGMRSCQTESGNWNNKALYNNTYLDELQRKAKVELDPEKRDALYEEIEEIIMEDAPLLYTVVEAVIIATKPNVKGIDIWPSGYYFFHNAYIEKK
jgi:peptide/nickel transport system substrate-binding protein